jgi:hypothetical protein
MEDDMSLRDQFIGRGNLDNGSMRLLRPDWSGLAMTLDNQMQTEPDILIFLAIIEKMYFV